ncbi:TPA: hypothetical protein R1X39_000603 [Campylobacter upsaliensis]|nr:hypothetical protein [Campylobacter upsaliensis]HEC1569213.1 hypothetical protein [Campylobacter upsaliensis]HEC1576576.1 hypothetical protein [Campylobacter upsaliensis]
MFYEDLGYFYIQQGLDKSGFGEKILHNFYEVPITSIDVIGGGEFTTMLNINKDDKIYAISFDFSSEILEKIIAHTSAENKILLNKALKSLGNDKFDLRDSIPCNIQAYVGQSYQNHNECYAPFIIKNIDFI